MNNAERMLTLVREHFARDCKMDTYIEGHKSRIRELHEKGRRTGVWNKAELEQVFDEYDEVWKRHEQAQSECYEQLARLRDQTSPDELTPEQHREIRELLSAGLALAKRHEQEALKAAEQAQRWAEGGPMPDC
jgi:hypothetical protein